MEKLSHLHIHKWRECGWHTQTQQIWWNIDNSAHTQFVVDQSTNQSIKANNGQLVNEVMEEWTNYVVYGACGMCELVFCFRLFILFHCNKIHQPAQNVKIYYKMKMVSANSFHIASTAYNLLLLWYRKTLILTYIVMFSNLWKRTVVTQKSQYLSLPPPLFCYSY